MKSIIPILLLFALLGFSCSTEIEEEVFFDENLLSIADYIEENKDTYSYFYRIMVEGSLYDPLNSYNPHGRNFTLFLPTDEAFERYIQNSSRFSSVDELLLDKEFIWLMGRYHLVNIDLNTNEFPYGAFPDTTATGDLLTIGFSDQFDSTVYKVNNVAPVIQSNLEMVNGYIHVISEVLEPVNFSGVQWLKDNPDFSILAKAFEITGLEDTLGLYRSTSSGMLVKNKYTILAEHDSIYSRAGINSIDDLIGEYATPGLPYTAPENGLYQFAAYHVMEGENFLVDFDQTRNYNTYANAPVLIEAGLEVRINPGVDTFHLEINNAGDTTAITHIGLYYQESNILTKNGAIHFLDEIMEFYTPRLSERIFQFYEEPEINKVRYESGNHYFLEEEQDELEVISWSGPKEILYFKASGSEPAANNDYLEIEGNFVINYTMPKILPGRYTLYLRANGYNRSNEHATIIVYIDGKRMSGNFDLNIGGTGTDPYAINNNWRGYKIGLVEFTKYTKHTITVESLIPGKFIWDQVSFRLPD